MSNLLTGASVLTLSLLVSVPQASAAVAADGSREQKTTNVEGKGIEVAGDMTATESSAEKGPGLEISGGTAFNTYIFKQRQREAAGGRGRGTHFASDDSRINFEVLGKAGPRLDGLEYSFLIGLTGNTEAGKTSVEENRIKLKHRYGTLMGGVHRGVTDFMAVGAFTFHAGTGNVLGNHGNVIAPTTGVVVKDDLAGHGKDRTMVTYVSPRFGGFLVGYCFSRDGEQSGEKKLATKTAASGGVVTAAGQHLHEVAANFKKDFMGGFGLQLSATGLFGRSKSTASSVTQEYKDIASYALGFVMNYAGFSLGGEYLNNGKSLEWKGLRGSDAGRVYNIGVGYAEGRHAVSLGYLYSKRKLGKNIVTDFDYGQTTGKVGALSYDYKVAKGLKVYAESVLFNYKTSSPAQAGAWTNATSGAAASSATPSNNGHAVMLGTAISF